MDSINHNFARIRINSYSFLPIEQFDFSQSVVNEKFRNKNNKNNKNMIRINVNRNKNNYNYNMFFKKGLNKNKYNTEYFQMKVCML